MTTLTGPKPSVKQKMLEFSFVGLGRIGSRTSFCRDSNLESSEYEAIDDHRATAFGLSTKPNLLSLL